MLNMIVAAALTQLCDVQVIQHVMGINRKMRTWGDFKKKF